MLLEEDIDEVVDIDDEELVGEDVAVEDVGEDVAVLVEAPPALLALVLNE